MVAARQETKWQFSEIFDTGDYGICYNCNKGTKLLLTGFMIRKAVNVPMLILKL